jgi:hypothetical protein
MNGNNSMPSDTGGRTHGQATTRDVAGMRIASRDGVLR